MAPAAARQRPEQPDSGQSGVQPSAARGRTQRLKQNLRSTVSCTKNWVSTLRRALHAPEQPIDAPQVKKHPAIRYHSLSPRKAMGFGIPKQPRRRCSLSAMADSLTSRVTLHPRPQLGLLDIQQFTKDDFEGPPAVDVDETICRLPSLILEPELELPQSLGCHPEMTPGATSGSTFSGMMNPVSGPCQPPATQDSCEQLSITPEAPIMCRGHPLSTWSAGSQHQVDEPAAKFPGSIGLPKPLQDVDTLAYPSAVEPFDRANNRRDGATYPSASTPDSILESLCSESHAERGAENGMPMSESEDVNDDRIDKSAVNEEHSSRVSIADAVFLDRSNSTSVAVRTRSPDMTDDIAMNLQQLGSLHLSLMAFSSLHCPSPLQYLDVNQEWTSVSPWETRQLATRMGPVQVCNQLIGITGVYSPQKRDASQDVRDIAEDLEIPSEIALSTNVTEHTNENAQEVDETVSTCQGSTDQMDGSNDMIVASKADCQTARTSGLSSNLTNSTGLHPREADLSQLRGNDSRIWEIVQGQYMVFDKAMVPKAVFPGPKAVPGGSPLRSHNVGLSPATRKSPSKLGFYGKLSGTLKNAGTAAESSGGQRESLNGKHKL